MALHLGSADGTGHNEAASSEWVANKLLVELAPKK